MTLHAGRSVAGFQKRLGRIHPIEKICRQDEIKFSKLSAQSGCIADLEPAARPVDLRGQVPGDCQGKVSLDSPKNLDLARFADFLGGHDEAARKVDTNYFSGKTRQFKGGAPDRTAKIERAVDRSNLVNELSDTTDWVEERLVWTERIGKLVLSVPIVKQEIGVERRISFVNVFHVGRGSAFQVKFAAPEAFA